MNTNPIKPCSNRVILEFFLGAFSETIEDGIIIPRDAQESMQKSRPKYRWVKIEAVGHGCVEAEVGQEALVYEANVEFIAVKGEKPFNYIQEGQIMALRDAQPKETSPSVD
jgi:co-chaperonin GroES (HSP10)